MVAPAARTLETIEASIGEIGRLPSLHRSSVNVPTVVGKPPIEMLSLMAIVLPWRSRLVGLIDVSSHR